MTHVHLFRVITAVLLVMSSTACTMGQAVCPEPTAKFPIMGKVVKKERIKQDCYMIHVQRDDNLNVQTVKLKYFRYTHVNLNQTINYVEQPTS